MPSELGALAALTQIYLGAFYGRVCYSFAIAFNDPLALLLLARKINHHPHSCFFGARENSENNELTGSVPEEFKDVLTHLSACNLGWFYDSVFLNPAFYLETEFTHTTIFIFFYICYHCLLPCLSGGRYGGNPGLKGIPLVCM